jgi:cytoskeleton protein RodZ
MDIGAALREARERRALSLEAVSRATRIRVPVLRAIEANQRDRLPPAIYLRGFVRACAREVGLDPEDTARQYLGQFETPSDPPTDGAAGQSSGAPRWHASPGRDGDGRAMQWLIVAAILLVALFASYRIAHRAADEAAVAAPAPVVEPAAAPATLPESVAAVTKNDDVLHLEVRARGLCWLSMSVDGARVAHRLMQPGEQLAVDVRSEAVLRIGDPAAFQFAINGRSGRPLGEAGQPVTIRLTPENYRELTAAPVA